MAKVCLTESDIDYLIFFVEHRTGILINTINEFKDSPNKGHDFDDLIRMNELMIDRNNKLTAKLKKFMAGIDRDTQQICIDIPE